MTAKEFEKVLTNCGIDFSIWGYEGIINIVSTYCSMEAKEYEKKNKKALVELYNDRAHKTYEYLESIGYYNV